MQKIKMYGDNLPTGEKDSVIAEGDPHSSKTRSSPSILSCAGTKTIKEKHKLNSKQISDSAFGAHLSFCQK